MGPASRLGPYQSMPTPSAPRRKIHLEADAYRNVASKHKARIDDKSLALVVADTLPLQMDLMNEGLSLGQVGQRPFEMGYQTMDFLKDIIMEGKNPGRPDLYRPRRLHARDRGHLHRRLNRPCP